MSTRSVVVRFSADTSAYVAATQKMSAATKAAAREAETASKKQAAAYQKVGDTAGKIGLVAAAGFTAITAVTANFEKQMSSVSAATGETAANMDRLRDAAITAGADTAFSASEAAAGIENLAKAGVSTADILGGGLSGALDLAAAGEIAVADAAEYAAKAMTQFGLSGDQVPHVADLLAAAAGKAVGDVGDFGQALNQVGLVASSTGLSIEDTVGTLASFAQAGLQGSDAGTAFKSMLQRLQNPLGQGAQALEDLGISAYDSQGQFVGITEVAGQLQSKLGDLTQQQRDAALAQIFGSDAVRAATILYQEGAAGIQGWIDQTDDAGYAAEQAAARLDNLAGDVEALKGSLETALIGTGTGSQGILRSTVQSLTSVVNAYNELGDTSKNAAAGTLAVTAALGGGVFVASRTIQSIAATRSAMDDLGISGTKGSKALKGLGVAAAGLAVLTTAGAAVQALNSKLDETLPTTAALTAQLINLAAAGGEGQLSAEFDSLADSIDRVTDKNLDQKVGDFLQTPFAGIFGEAGSLREAKAEIDSIDRALADLVNSAGANEAEAMFMMIAEAQGLTASETERLRGELDDFGNALEESANSAAIGTGALDGLTGALYGSADASNTMRVSAAESQKAIEERTDAMRDARSAALEAFDAETRYAEALREAEKQSNRNNAGIDASTKAGRNNRDALSGLAQAWNNTSDATKNARGAYDEVREGLIDVARDMGVGRREARKLADELLEVPPKTVTDAVLNTGRFQSAYDMVRGNIDDIDRAVATAMAQLDDRASAGISTIRYAMQRLDGTTATVTTYETTIRQTLGAATPRQADLAASRAAGGPVRGHTPLTLPAQLQPTGAPA